MGNAHTVDPDFETTLSVFICGNSEQAKTEVTGVLSTFGWEVEDMAGAEAAEAINPLAMLWRIPLFKGSKRDYALKLIHM